MGPLALMCSHMRPNKAPSMSPVPTAPTAILAHWGRSPVIIITHVACGAIVQIVRLVRIGTVYGHAVLMSTFATVLAEIVPPVSDVVTTDDTVAWVDQVAMIIGTARAAQVVAIAGEDPYGPITIIGIVTFVE